jgi:hypothetical protein
VLAFKAEITRIATMMYARDLSGAVARKAALKMGSMSPHTIPMETGALPAVSTAAGT